MEMCNYTTQQGFECLNSCIVNHIRNRGFDIQQIDPLLLSHGLKYTYKNMHGIPKIETKVFQSTIQYIKKIGLNYEYGQFYGNNDLDFISSSIAGSKSLILSVAAEKLSYNQVYKQNQNIQHFINIVGVDIINSRVKISDGCAPTYEDSIYDGWVSFDELIFAWEKMKKLYIVLDFAEKTYPVLDNQVRKYLFIHEIKRCKKNLKNKIFYSGILSIKKYQKVIMNYLNLFLEKNDNMILYNASQQLKINGVICQKKIIYEYLNHIHLPETNLLNYKNLITSWNNISVLFIKIMLKNKKTDIHQLNECFEKIYLKEKNCIEEILFYLVGERG